jgi:hypothetical protein
MKTQINFRQAWNKYNVAADAKLPKNITKEYAFILKCHYCLGQAVKEGFELKDEVSTLKALADMEKKNIPLNFARLMIHKTHFEA